MAEFRGLRFQVKARLLALFFGLGVLGCSVVRGQVPEYGGADPLAPAKGKEVAVLAGGCFWGVDAVFKHVQGVMDVVSGYSGGDSSAAEYEVVSSGRTGHAESVKITYDPGKISYAQLLRVFFSVATDPTQLNRQGPDVGTQYRSVIFYANDAQKQVALAYIDQLNKSHIFSGPIVTQVVPLTHFYPAEAYHQNYLALHPDEPYIVYNDLPKLRALKEEFPGLYRP
ncbi:MAG: peptide-methionine (S)-S-oxide reductase MsrA [Terriglobia bacterium]